MRTMPGIYLSWGVSVSRCAFRGGIFPSMGCARCRWRDRWIEVCWRALAPGKGVILCDTKGYPLAAVGGPEVDADFLTRSARRPTVDGRAWSRADRSSRWWAVGGDAA